MKRAISFLSIVFLFTINQKISAQNCDSNPPKNLSATNISSCSITFSWEVSNTVKWVKVAYRITGGTWSSWIKVTGSSSYTFNNLIANTSYDFKVFSKCTDGTQSDKIKLKGIYTLACTPPSSITLLEQKTHSLEFSILSSCSLDSVHIKYSTLTGPQSTVSFPVSPTYLLEGLDVNTQYLIQFSTCPLAQNNYSTIDTYTTANLPNIIFILADDARNDYLSIGGAPDFFQTPNIDRIGHEGVDFRNAYVVTSLCAPSRATIATGLFTLKTGVGGNAFKLDASFYTVPEVLRDNGYYTALVGKNHGTFVLGANPEFDYYMASSGSSGTFNLNGSSITLPAAYVLSVTDTAIGVIKKNTGQPLFMWLAYRVPHLPHVSLPGFEHKFDTQVIPWAPDTAKYQNNYPSTLYPLEESLLHGYRLDTTYRDILEDMAGLDSCIGEVLKAISETGKLDNTLVIFTSDNGYLMGTHWLGGKTYSFEPSMKIPLLIRFPEWFKDSSVVTNELATNMDIASTIYEAAEISSPPETDGISLHKLYTGESHRNAFFYYMRRVGKHDPTEKSIRDLHYKYTRFICDSITEMFFDMANDPLELTNLVNNSAYDSLINIYRNKFDSIQMAWNDTVTVGTAECHIENPFYLKELIDEQDLGTDEPLVYPTIISNYVEVFIPWTHAKISLMNTEGKLIKTFSITDQFTRIDLPDLRAGIYFLKFESDAEIFTSKLVKQ